MQFVGLRSAHWSVSLIQLGLTIIVTAIRCWISRNLSSDFSRNSLPGTGVDVPNVWFYAFDALWRLDHGTDLRKDRSDRLPFQLTLLPTSFYYPWTIAPGSVEGSWLLPHFRNSAVAQCAYVSCMIDAIAGPNFDVDRDKSNIEWWSTIYGCQDSSDRALYESPLVREEDLEHLRACLEGVMEVVDQYTKELQREHPLAKQRSEIQFVIPSVQSLERKMFRKPQETLELPFIRFRRESRDKKRRWRLCLLELQAYLVLMLTDLEKPQSSVFENGIACGIETHLGILRTWLGSSLSNTRLTSWPLNQSAALLHSFDDEHATNPYEEDSEARPAPFIIPGNSTGHLEISLFMKTIRATPFQQFAYQLVMCLIMAVVSGLEALPVEAADSSPQALSNATYVLQLLDTIIRSGLLQHSYPDARDEEHSAALALIVPAFVKHKLIRQWPWSSFNRTAPTETICLRGKSLSAECPDHEGVLRRSEIDLGTCLQFVDGELQ
jgi:hypothetical protein